LTRSEARELLTAEHTSAVLAVLQATDLVVTRLSPKYGEEHLDQLGVPRRIRAVLPIAKAAAVGALIVSSRRPALRSIVGASLVAYYSAAAAFHVSAGDSPVEVLPAAACCVLATTLVWRPHGP
jgi:hypothetical protein